MDAEKEDTATLMQYLLFLLAHPISTHFSAAAPSFNKRSYKSEVTGTLLAKPTPSTCFFANSVIVGEAFPIEKTQRIKRIQPI